MKLATFQSGGRDKIGLVHGNDSRLFDLATAGIAMVRQSGFRIDVGADRRRSAALDQARPCSTTTARTKPCRLIPPRPKSSLDPEPRQMPATACRFRCTSCRRRAASSSLHPRQERYGRTARSMQSRSRIAGSLSQQAIYYITNRFSVRGTNTTVKWPRYTQGDGLRTGIRDHHQEQGREYPGFEGQDHIFGYTISNDFSARDPSASKWKDASVPPRARALTAARHGSLDRHPDEIGDPYHLNMEVRVNGKMRSQGFRRMLFSRSRRSSNM